MLLGTTCIPTLRGQACSPELYFTSRTGRPSSDTSFRPVVCWQPITTARASFVESFRLPDAPAVGPTLCLIVSAHKKTCSLRIADRNAQACKKVSFQSPAIATAPNHTRDHERLKPCSRYFFLRNYLRETQTGFVRAGPNVSGRFCATICRKPVLAAELLVLAHPRT
jgi:hypothetical protein